MGVLIHVAGDAANNVGVIVAGAVIWKTKSHSRYYADPAVSLAIAFMIFFASIPLGVCNRNDIFLMTGDTANMSTSQKERYHSPGERPVWR